jgi:hypothetical protein
MQARATKAKDKTAVPESESESDDKKETATEKEEQEDVPDSEREDTGSTGRTNPIRKQTQLIGT